MKTAIVYSSKTGTVKKCAELIRDMLSDAELFSLEKRSCDFSRFDTLVFGTYIRMGRPSRALVKLAKKNPTLPEKWRCAVFVCGCTGNPVEALNKALPEEFLSHCVIVSGFGGELSPENASGLEKKMLQKMLGDARASESVPEINIEKINLFVEEIAE